MGTITVAGNVYSDFAANLPLIRSFSEGQNFPPQYPLFPGEPIRYHFLFYLLVGLLEKVGIPLGWALNLPSILSFWALLLMIYFLAKLLFKNRVVAVLSVVLFLFNASFAFYYFFQNHPLSFPQTIEDILANQKFATYGPYDQNIIVDLFWNLNVFTNQRHFASGLFITLSPFYLILRARVLSWRTSLLLGAILGFLPFWHGTGFIMSVIILSGLLILFPNRKRTLFTLLVAGFIALPQFLYLDRAGGISSIQFHPGYIVSSDLSLFNFLRFWLLNLGLGFFLIPLGFLLAPPVARRIFLVIFPIFILGNLLQISPDINVNHKFFNLFILVSNMFIAFAIFYLWQKHLLFKILAPFLIIFLTLSGIIDLFAIKNDRFLTISDRPSNPTVVWIEKNTPPSTVFLNSFYLYHPASLAGRKIFLGWPYFSWSAGYDTDNRFLIQKKIYQGGKLNDICDLLKENKIGYVETQTALADQNIPINQAFWEKNFRLLHQNPQENLEIYSVTDTCR